MLNHVDLKQIWASPVGVRVFKIKFTAIREKLRTFSRKRMVFRKLDKHKFEGLLLLSLPRQQKL
jgi:hypothetical protein